MEIRGVKKLETSLGNISIRKTPPSVNVLDENLIPLEYIETKHVIAKNEEPAEEEAEEAEDAEEAEE
jgi:hypothetical protein